MGMKRKLGIQNNANEEETRNPEEWETRNLVQPRGGGGDWAKIYWRGI